VGLPSPCSCHLWGKSASGSPRRPGAENTQPDPVAIQNSPAGALRPAPPGAPNTAAPLTPPRKSFRSPSTKAVIRNRRQKPGWLDPRSGVGRLAPAGGGLGSWRGEAKQASREGEIVVWILNFSSRFS